MVIMKDGTVFETHNPDEGVPYVYKTLTLPKGDHMSQLLKVYSIRDSKSEIFHPPFYSRTHGEAERSFHQLVNDPKSNVNQFPEDFDLYELGEYDDATGKFSLKDSPAHVLKAALVLRPN